MKHYITTYNTPELIFLIPTRTHEQALFFCVFRASKVPRRRRARDKAFLSRACLALLACLRSLETLRKKSRLFCKLRVYKRKIRLRHSRISQNHIVSLIKLLLITITHIPFDHPWNTVEYPTAFSPSDWLYSLWYAEINSRPEIT